MTAIRAKISDSGRLSIPASFRRAIGLNGGGDVIVELAGREIRVRTLDEVIGGAQELTRRLLGKKTDASVAAFIAGRRGESKRE
ncbi:MAG: AbrB/MazE/SpoVT family DNA-binding domain-containing protein [Alphaproteobacteria bacterium]|nr:AbrB/MazE/SpoVT family DNA-binding domain-containing protein [Alphaproteobacteria bacterium]